MNKCAREWANEYTFFGAPNKDVLTIGALLKISDSLEKIARALAAMSPAERERSAMVKREREAFAAKKDLALKAEAYMRGRGISPELKPNLRTRTISLAFADMFGSVADFDSPDNWRRLSIEGPGVYRAFGKLTGKTLARWVDETWPRAGGAE